MLSVAVCRLMFLLLTTLFGVDAFFEPARYPPSCIQQNLMVGKFLYQRRKGIHTDEVSRIAISFFEPTRYCPV